MRGFRFFLIFLLQLFVLHLANAQYALPDVLKAFNAISTTPQVLQLKAGIIKVPLGGHLQGIQALSDSVFIITGSSSSYSYYLTTNRNELTALYKISDPPYRHAGGCQIAGDHLAVGVEDNEAKDKSNITDILLDEKGRELSKVVTIERKGTFKRSTAGAVGEIFTDTMYSWVMAVADWDSRNIDFYYSTNGDSMAITDSAAIMVTPADHRWCSYQSINLVKDSAGSPYLIGFGLDGTNNRADLFTVSLGPHRAVMHLIGTRNFKCKGASFRYGAGIGTTPDAKLVIYSCGRNISNHTPVNIFR